MHQLESKHDRLLYLKDDMKIMGYFFELLPERIYNVDVEDFFYHFMRSDIREAMDNLNPQLLNMASYNVLERYLETGVNIKYLKEQKYYRENELYWVGSVYPYISVYKEIKSKELVKILPFNKILDMYPLGHEMGYSSFLSHLKI